MNKTVKYRKDYEPCPFLIHTTQLAIDLYEDKAVVTTRLAIERRKDVLSKELILDGENQQLLAVKLNGVSLLPDQYTVSSDKLAIKNVPDKFEIELISENKPCENTDLMGLYLSGGTFCTQCEAEGFRRITYYLDRPDVMAVFTTKITADKSRYPVLLANGNLIEHGELPNNRHYAVWHDPFKKPCYLFAMVAGNLAKIEDHFVTQSARRITLQIFASQTAISQCHFAMEAIKKSMRWDEINYGREYDLDIFMIVAVNDFNFGAMENKGLNIFNDKYILADSQTATDQDYSNIDMVVGHEYFHNWSGNRVTLRDWFQLSLKEGFTVFREQSFTEHVGLAVVDRIQNIKRLRSLQFAEDAGPLAHPVRPDSYIEMNNFYTMTVYEKGAEVIRMLRTILGDKKYRAGTDLYFKKFDGQAVTCDDFVGALEEAADMDLTQFKLWYSQAGTPTLTVKTRFDKEQKTFTLQVEQYCPPTPAQVEKLAMHIPFSVGLINSNGEDMVSKTLNLRSFKESFVFEGVEEKPYVSLLRGFSAPVKVRYDYTESELAFLMAHDTDEIARWEAGQQFALHVLFSLMKDYQDKRAFSPPTLFLNSLNTLLTTQSINKALLAEMLALPDEAYLSSLLEIIDVDAIIAARRYLQVTMAQVLRETLLSLYRDNVVTSPYQYQIDEVAKRSLKNVCLHYLSYLDDEMISALCYEQFKSANNMTDQFAALSALLNTSSSDCEKALNAFYETWQHAPLVIDKWFMVQVSSSHPDVLNLVEKLLVHPAFNLKNPNKVRVVLGSLTRNFPAFHKEDGRAYNLITEYVIKLDDINSMGAARLASAFSAWKNYTSPRKELMQEALKQIAAKPNLSSDVYEIVEKSL